MGGRWADTRVRVVVGEGHPARKGLLRFVLEGEGYDVVAQRDQLSELARMLATTSPTSSSWTTGSGQPPSR